MNEKKEIKNEKKEKNLKKNDNKNEKDKNEHDKNKRNLDIKNLVSQIIDDSVTKSYSRGVYPKVNAYQIFKEEYQQMSNGKDEDKSENEIQNAWNKVPKELKKFYNIKAENQNKIYKDKRKLYKKKKEDEEKADNNKKDKKEKKQNENE